MNRIAGLIGSIDRKEDREWKLRQALAYSGSHTHIMHPTPNVSLGWSSNSELIAFVESTNGFALVYGSAYYASGVNSLPIGIDNIQNLAHLLLARYSNNQPLLAGLDGAFMALLKDEGKGVVITGDPVGNRTPYFASEDGQLAFASHPLLCARLLGSPTLDRGFEDFFLIYGFLPQNYTVYHGVRQLQPADILIKEKEHDKWGQKTLIVNADVEYDSKMLESEDSLYEQLYNTLLDCTQDQVASDKSVGVLLGGFDSALVASLLHRLGKRVHTYSFRYKKNEYNQPHTDALSAFLGCEHKWIDITPSTIATGLDNYAEFFVQPTNWLNYVIQTVHVCQRMREDGIDYAYSGDGCDAVFLGYPGTYKRTLTFARLPQLPSWLVKTLISILARPTLDRAIGHPYRVAMNLLRATARPMPERAFLSFRVLDEITLTTLRQGNKPEQYETIEAISKRLSEPFAKLSIQRLGYVAKSLISPNRTKLLAATDVAGVNINSPYLHRRLRTFASRIPDHLLREQQQSTLADPGKICLMRMAEKKQLLPTEVIHQPKLAAIDSPIDDWFAYELRSCLESALAGLPFEPDPNHLNALIHTTAAERFYKHKIGSTRVISDGISLLATYGVVCGGLNS